MMKKTLPFIFASALTFLFDQVKPQEVNVKLSLNKPFQEHRFYSFAKSELSGAPCQVLTSQVLFKPQSTYGFGISYSFFFYPLEKQETAEIKSKFGELAAFGNFNYDWYAGLWQTSTGLVGLRLGYLTEMFKAEVDLSKFIRINVETSKRLNVKSYIDINTEIQLLKNPYFALSLGFHKKAKQFYLDNLLALSSRGIETQIGITRYLSKRLQHKQGRLIMKNLIRLRDELNSNRTKLSIGTHLKWLSYATAAKIDTLKIIKEIVKVDTVVITKPKIIYKEKESKRVTLTKNRSTQTREISRLESKLESVLTSFEKNKNEEILFEYASLLERLNKLKPTNKYESYLVEERVKLATQYYEKALNLYIKEEFDEAIENASKVIKLLGKSAELIPTGSPLYENALTKVTNANECIERAKSLKKKLNK